MIAIESGKSEVAGCRGGWREPRAGSWGPPEIPGGARQGDGVRGNHPRRSLLEPERGSKKQHTAWGMTMSSVSLESKKQGRESKVEAGELEEVSSEMAGGSGLFCWLGRTRHVCPTQADCV